MASPAPPGRRARLRAQTTAEILAAARQRLGHDGAAGLSLRAIARDLGMGVASLYRYFPSRDDLLTALLVEAFDAQADAVQAAARTEPEPVAAIRAGLTAYRRWSLDHPEAFALAYGTPVPGYQAPPDRTIPAGARSGGILVDLLATAHAAGLIDDQVVARREGDLADPERRDLQAVIDRRSYAISPALMSLAADLFVHVHGFVVMEVLGQLRPLYADPSHAFRRTVTHALSSVGMS